MPLASISSNYISRNIATLQPTTSTQHQALSSQYNVSVVKQYKVSDIVLPTSEDIFNVLFVFLDSPLPTSALHKVDYMSIFDRLAHIRPIKTIKLFLLLAFLSYASTKSSVVVVAMRLVVQKVKSASVTVENNVISSIGPGMVALVGLHENDTNKDLEYCCKKLLGCKLWANDNNVMWRHGVKTRNLEVLCVSQFTLYGTVNSKKHQPDYKLAMKSIPAEIKYNEFLSMLRVAYEDEKIKDGKFGAMMDVALVNDGPVTLVIDSFQPEAIKAEKDQEDQEA